MSEKKLPSAAGGHAAAGQCATKIAQRLDEMRGERAVAPPRTEERTVRYVCAVAGKRFAVIYRRQLPAAKFRIGAIEKRPDPQRGAGLLGRLLRRPGPLPEVYSLLDFDRTGWLCPWCGATGSVLPCNGCGENVCHGRTHALPDGRLFYRCREGCDGSGVLFAATEIAGESGSGKDRGATTSIAPPSRETLRGSNALRLPKK